MKRKEPIFLDTDSRPESLPRRKNTEILCQPGKQSLNGEMTAQHSMTAKLCHKFAVNLYRTFILIGGSFIAAISQLDKSFF